MPEKKIKCCICKESDWKDLDYFRQKKEDFVICNLCGFVTYLIKENQYLIDMYKESKHNPARKFSGTIDDKTKSNKLPYHRRFIGEYLESRKDMSILDFGCSTGYVLKMCRDEYGHDDVTGIELNPAHAVYGRSEFDLDIYEVATMDEFNDQLIKKDIACNKKFDLIIVFAVLEHLLDPVEKMKTFKKYLKPKGKMYIMVPLWFNGLLDSEQRVGHFEHLFVPHHINCFSTNHIANTFKLAGFKPSQYCGSMYGHMFLLDQCEPVPKELIFDDPKKIVEEISLIKKGIELMKLNRFQDSLEAYPRNPEIWIKKALSEFKNDFNNSLKCLQTALEIDRNYTTAVMHTAELFMQKNDYENAEKFALKAIEMSPNCYYMYILLTQIYYLRAVKEKDEKLFSEAIGWAKLMIQTNPRMGHEKHQNPNDKNELTARDWIGFIYAKIAELKNEETKT